MSLILTKNRRILKQLLGKDYEKIVTKEMLLKKGFEENYYTHHKLSIVAKYKYTFCFDYGYRKADDTSFKIVKAFNYKDE